MRVKINNKKDREFVELEIPYNGQPKRPGSPSPMASPAHSTNSNIGLLQSCCGRCCSQRYQVCFFNIFSKQFFSFYSLYI